MERDNFVCAECLCDNSERQLQVHHIAYYDYDRMAWDYPDYLLVTLCKDCHDKEHKEKAITNPKRIIEWIIKLLTPNG